MKVAADHWTIPHPARALSTVARAFRAPADTTRQVLEEARLRIRGYAAAGISRETMGWTTTPDNADSLVRRELRTLRARSREQAASNDYARRYVSLLQSNVVGAHGLKLDSQVADPDGTADVQARKGIESAWRAWGEAEPDVTGRLSWLEIERQGIRTAAVDGEILLRFREGREAGPWGFQVQVLDPELLDVELNQRLSDGGAIRQGVEVDAWGKPRAYHLLQVPRGAAPELMDAATARKHRRVPADEILHAFLPEWVGQARGLPWMATALKRLRMLGGYEEAALTHARVGAMSLGFLRKEPGAEGFRGDTKSARNDGSTELNLEPGEFNTLPTGVSLETYDPRYPSGEFAPFSNHILKGISAGLGPAYTSLSQNLEGTSYAGGRMGLLEERELYRALQTWYAGQVHRHVFRRWLKWALLMDRVTHPVTGSPFPSSRLDKFREHRWQGKRWPWVDPRNDAQAAELMVKAGLTTESKVIRELGDDPTEVWEERRLELEERRKRGLTTSTDSAPAPDAPAPRAAEDDDTDPDEPLVAPRNPGGQQ